MSNHLAILMRAGLVAVEKDGRAMNYRADVTGFRGLATLILLFAFQGEQILAQPTVIAILAVPILPQHGRLKQ
jgi:ACR3 family arsenite efflux pump ArsB